MSLILAIETSCDETAAAVIEDGHRIRSNVVASQIELHRPYGGVFPEIASRQHVYDIVPVIEAALTDSGATVLMLTYPDFGEIMAVARRLRPRLQAYNEQVRVIAARHGARLMDLERGGATDARLFHPDRLHANGLGHERIALAAAEALGLPGADDRWREPLSPAPTASRLHVLRDDARWARAHLAPWVSRRLRGVSSGDGVRAKRPEPAPVRPGTPVA